MTCYPEPDSNIQNKVKILLDFSNHAAKKELRDTTSVDTSNLTAKVYFIRLGAEIVKLDIDELVNVPGSLNDLKTEVDVLDADKLKGVHIDLKKLRDLVVKKTKYDKL